MQKWDYLRLVRSYHRKGTIEDVMVKKAGLSGGEASKIIRADAWKEGWLWNDAVEGSNKELAERRIDDRLSDMGKKGWELVNASIRERVYSKIDWFLMDKAARSISVYEFYFKRPLEE